MTGRSVDPPEVRLARAAAAAVAPFFRLTADAAGPPWQHSADLYRDGLPRLLDAAAARLGSPEARGTASIVPLGYAARLWSPVLCCSLLHGIVLDLTQPHVAAG